MWMTLSCENIPVLDYLLSRGQKIKAKHFVTAAMTGNIESLRRLMMFGGDVNLSDSHGNTPLLAAIQSRNPEAVREVLGYGANPNICNSFDECPLDLAIQIFDRPSLVEDFIKAGADVNYRNWKGVTPLTRALRKDIRDILIAAGATDEGVEVKNEIHFGLFD
jgi:uncharacterized protein